MVCLYQIELHYLLGVIRSRNEKILHQQLNPQKQAARARTSPHPIKQYFLRQAENILTEYSGVRKNGGVLTTFVQGQSLFIIDDVIEEIVLSTNEFIQKKAPLYYRSRHCITTQTMSHKNLKDLICIQMMTEAFVSSVY